MSRLIPILFFILTIPFYSFSQNLQIVQLNKNLSKFYSEKSNKKPDFIHTNFNNMGIGNLLLNFYQKVISIQISGDCIYSTSCSRYARVAIKKKGLIPGSFLSIDRLSRCNKAGYKDAPYFMENDEGYLVDDL